MLETKEVVITTQAGLPKTYILSKMPYLGGAREVLTQFIQTATPKIGNYAENESLCLKMFQFIGIPQENGMVQYLTTRELVNNHVPDFQTGIKLEKEMLEYNFGFFPEGTLSAFSKSIAQKVQPLIIEILTALRAQSSPKEERPSRSSKKTTRRKKSS